MLSLQEVNNSVKLLGSQNLTEGSLSMRIQMRLSQEARIILEEEKLVNLKNGQKKTAGQIIDSIFKQFENRLTEIDWQLVQTSPNYQAILSDYTVIAPTTFNLTADTLAIIETFRDYFNQDERLQIKRTVYRSFVIRMVLKAYKMTQDQENISK